MRTLVTVVEHCSESSPGDIPEPVKEKTTVEVNKKLPREKKNLGECRGVVVPIFLSLILRFKEERKESQFVGTPLAKSPKSGIAALSK